MLRRKVSGFHIFNYAFLSLLILVCIAPILHVIALSFSQKIEAVAGHVGLLPVGFNVEAYRYVMEDSQFWTSLGVTLLRVVIGVPVNIFLVVMTAYPLSKSTAGSTPARFSPGFSPSPCTLAAGRSPCISSSAS